MFPGAAANAFGKVGNSRLKRLTADGAFDIESFVIFMNLSLHGRSDEAQLLTPTQLKSIEPPTGALICANSQEPVWIDKWGWLWLMAEWSIQPFSQLDQPHHQPPAGTR
jgi:hypothetical protein